jgi:hypothetical protein
MKNVFFILATLAAGSLSAFAADATLDNGKIRIVADLDKGTYDVIDMATGQVEIMTPSFASATGRRPMPDRSGRPARALSPTSLARASGCSCIARARAGRNCGSTSSSTMATAR